MCCVPSLRGRRRQEIERWQDLEIPQHSRLRPISLRVGKGPAGLLLGLVDDLRPGGAHVCIVGHITRSELRRLMSETDLANGLANRFLWFCVRRSKILPEGGNLCEDDLAALVQRVRSAVEFARQNGELKRDEQARALWRDVYPSLSEGKPGLLGAATSRAEAIVMRVAMLYALLDQTRLIAVEHLRAGLAVWQ